jgi:3-methyl-2-oxobutanoate hydroxymethyltransferase
MTTASSGPDSRAPLSAPDISARKGNGPPLVMVTAYDFPSARVADGAGVDMILVGDTLAMVVLGHDDTLHVTIDDMAHHVAAAARAKPRALLIGDLPWLSYHVSDEETVHNAAHLVRAGAAAVKLEGGRKRLGAIEAILDAEIPVMGHLGLTPQSAIMLGGFKAQGRTASKATQLLEDAKTLERVGCFAVVLEAVPAPVAARIAEELAIPTIGIGSGRDCDGQVLVYHDLLGLYQGKAPRFVKRYAELAPEIQDALERFAADVRAGAFPGEEHTYSIPDDELEAFLRGHLKMKT